MLDSVYKLGKLSIEKEDLDEIDVLLDNKNIGAVVLIDFIVDESPVRGANAERRWLDFIVNSVLTPPQSVQKNRRFAPYDTQ